MKIEEILKQFVASLPEEIRQQVSVDSETVEGRVYLSYEYTDEEITAHEPSAQAEKMFSLWDAWPDSVHTNNAGIDGFTDKCGDEIVHEYMMWEVENDE